MKYGDFTRAHKKLMSLRITSESMVAGKKEDDAFWAAHEEFREQLLEGLRSKPFLISLHKSQFVQFLAWCSTFRPEASHSILGRVSGMLDKE